MAETPKIVLCPARYVPIAPPATPAAKVNVVAAGPLIPRSLANNCPANKPIVNPV